MHVVLKCQKCFHLEKRVETKFLNHRTVFLRWCYDVNCNCSQQHWTWKILKIKHFNRNMKSSVYQRLLSAYLIFSSLPRLVNGLKPMEILSENWMSMGPLNLVHLILNKEYENGKPAISLTFSKAAYQSNACAFLLFFQSCFFETNIQ